MITFFNMEEIYIKIPTVPDFIDKLNRVRKQQKYAGEFSLSEMRGLDDKSQYTTFFIPKKNGGRRQIWAPKRDLQFLQHCISILLKKYFTPNENAYGFIQGKSIAQNAAVHTNHDIVYNIDLKDFFHSIHQNLIIKSLTRGPFRFAPSVARFISQYTTVFCETDNKRRLPQGAPSSPLITNIVASQLDLRLSKLCEKFSITYSRYVDDMTFSFDKSLLKRWKNNGFRKGLRDIITEIIEDEGLKINKRKTRISFKGQQQEVTGLVVNNKVNVQRTFIKKLRTILHNWDLDGYVIASYKLNSHNIDLGRSTPKFKLIEDVIAGKLSYLQMVKGKEDSTYIRLKTCFDQLIERDSAIIRSHQKSSIPNIFKHRPKFCPRDKNSPFGDASSHWSLREERPFTPQEKNMIQSYSLVPSPYGQSIKIELTTGKHKYIPLSKSSSLNTKEIININATRIQILSMIGKRDIIRVKI